MLDFGAGELVVIGVVALVAIGPKELPGVLRAVGKSVGKMRRMAGEFQNQFSDAMREMELEEARKKVEEMGKQMSDSVAEATKDSAAHIDTYLAETASKPVSADPSASEQTVSGENTPAPSILPDLPPIPEVASVSGEQIMANVEASVAAMNPSTPPSTPSSTPPATPVGSDAVSATAPDGAAPVTKSASS